MTPEAQRIAIAEACGWYEIHYYGTENNGPESDIDPPRLVGKRSKFGVGSWAIIRSVPHYHTDLNAMHEAEETLHESQRVTYSNELYDLAVEHQLNTGKWRYLSMTASQRAEAFLRTLGKWEEGK